MATGEGYFSILRRFFYKKIAKKGNAFAFWIAQGMGSEPIIFFTGNSEKRLCYSSGFEEFHDLSMSWRFEKHPAFLFFLNLQKSSILQHQQFLFLTIRGTARKTPIEKK